MRTAYAYIAAATLVQVGYSALVAHSGKQMGTLGSREAVHETFGAPSVAVETDDGRFLEEFVTRRKIAESWKVQGYGLVGIGTCGLSELYYLPTELFFLARHSVLGQQFQVEYDREGRVVVMYRDGVEVRGTRNQQIRSAIEPPPPPYIPCTAAQATTTGTARFAPPSRSSP